MFIVAGVYCDAACPSDTGSRDREPQQSKPQEKSMLFPKPLSPTMLAWLAVVLVPLQPMLHDGGCCCPDGQRATLGNSGAEASNAGPLRGFAEGRPSTRQQCCTARHTGTESSAPVGGVPCNCEVRPAPPLVPRTPALVEVCADASDPSALPAATETMPETRRPSLSGTIPHPTSHSSVAVCRLLCRYLL